MNEYIWIVYDNCAGEYCEYQFYNNEAAAIRHAKLNRLNVRKVKLASDYNYDWLCHTDIIEEFEIYIEY